jgi:hypothetical protein
MGKGKCWSQQEDLALCEQWVAVSEDPVSGTYQKKDTFWSKIHSSLKTDRTSSSVQNRWSDISRDVLKFIGILAQVSKVAKSGWTVVEYEIQATLVFRRDEEKDFLFKHCYEFLKDKKKFTHPNSGHTFPSSNVSVKTGTPENNSKGSKAADGDSSKEKEGRPIGTKQAKLAIKKQKLDEKNQSLNEKTLELQRNGVEAAKVQAEALSLNTNLKFMAMLAADDPVRKQWIEHEKQKFAQKLQMEKTSKEAGTKETHEIEVVGVSKVSPSTISMLSDSAGDSNSCENDGIESSQMTLFHEVVDVDKSSEDVDELLAI